MRAYRAGLLSPSYNNPTSRLREQFMLNEIEREILCDILDKRIQLDSQLIAFGRKESFTAAYSQLDNYVELTLPYLHKPDTINNADLLKPVSDKSSKEDLDVFRAIIAARKAKEAEEKAKNNQADK